MLLAGIFIVFMFNEGSYNGFHSWSHVAVWHMVKWTMTNMQNRKAFISMSLTGRLNLDGVILCSIDDAWEKIIIKELKQAIKKKLPHCCSLTFFSIMLQNAGRKSMKSMKSMKINEISISMPCIQHNNRLW